MPEPFTAPAPAPEPTVPAVELPTPAAAANEAEDVGQTTAAEEAAIDEQINEFISKVAPDTAETPTAPAPEQVAQTPVSPEPAPELTPTQAPADSVAPVPAEAAPVQSQSDQVAINGKKVVISPLGSPTTEAKPDLAAMAAQEEGVPAATPHPSVTAPDAAPAQPPKPNNGGVDPNSIAL
jgi:hypothetical protein